MEWYLPDSAPENTRILVWVDEPSLATRGSFFGRAYRSHSGEMVLMSNSHNGTWNITHWAPQPEGPNGEKPEIRA